MIDGCAAAPCAPGAGHEAEDGWPTRAVDAAMSRVRGCRRSACAEACEGDLALCESQCRAAAAAAWAAASAVSVVRVGCFD
jgi:hypothetical protein